MANWDGFFVLVAVFGLSLLVIAFRLRLSHRGLALPNSRSLHARPTPHGGGLGILLPVMLAWAWLGLPLFWVGLLFVLAAVSWWDDVRPLAFGWRLSVHALCAALAMAMLGTPFGATHGLGTWAILLLGWAGLVWGTNAYNFMDGSDGLAGAMGVLGFATYALAFWHSGMPHWAQASAAVSLGCAGFLVFNWPPARLFMGDVGAIPLGFLSMALGWAGWVWGVWPLWFPLWVFGVFGVDASVTLARRVLAGKPFWQAHREHLYQTMALSGWGHRGVLLRLGLAMLLMQASALGLWGLHTHAPGLATALAWAGLVGAVWLRLRIPHWMHKRAAP